MFARRAAGAFTAAALVAGCGVPSETAKQAEAVGSVAAEAALLAHDAAEGDTLGPYARVHAEALRKNLRALEPKIRDRALAQVARAVDDALTRLADAPGDEARAAALERRLEGAARRSEELAR